MGPFGFFRILDRTQEDVEGLEGLELEAATEAMAAGVAVGVAQLAKAAKAEVEAEILAMEAAA